MTRTRWLALGVVLTFTGTACSVNVQDVRRPVIELPALLAIELPQEGMTDIAPTASPLRELLAAARMGEARVSHDQVKPLPIGATQVTWTAWAGVVGSPPVLAVRKAYVYVLPWGQTPVGLSGDDRATGGNHSAKIVRDSAGKLHMVWLDSDRPGVGSRVMYRRAAQDPHTGRVIWETDALRVSDATNEVGNSYTGIEASEDAVHIAWYGRSSVQYRRAVRRGGVWSFEPTRDTGVRGSSGDDGPDLGVRGDAEIHVLSPSGGYAFSTNGGLRWRLDHVPWTRGPIKGTALAVDSQGNAHVTFTAMIRSPKEWSTKSPNDGYWELRYVRRQAGGGWMDAQNVLAGHPEWADARNGQDVLVDWSDVAVDANGAIHIVWHGSANTRLFGSDEAFYVRRPATAPGSWGAWGGVQALHPIERARRQYFSFAPSLCVDPATDTALAVVFFDVTDADQRFDVDARVVRGGVVEGAPIALSRLAVAAVEAGRTEDAPSVWFPSAAPRLYRDARSRAWLDVLGTLVTPQRHASPHYVVYMRHDVTERLKPAR